MTSRHARSALFDNYTGDRRPAAADGPRNHHDHHPHRHRSSTNPNTNNTATTYGNGNGNGYGYGYANGEGGSSSSSSGERRIPNGGGAGGAASYRPATANTRGQYSDAVLSSLESQNDEALEGVSAKVKMLKDITIAIGDEIRDSTALAEKMNHSFDHSRVRIRSTMNRMRRMADRTGVGWKVWLAFFVVVGLLFWYVWLF
ncbi:MAG: protein transport protein bet1 [Phylliscum demangeonii]|nr:MAG: protein transport protein bet1 [Phylliscum demangeonii]